MRLSKLLLITTIVSILSGQLIRLNFASSVLTLTDIFMATTIVVFIAQSLLTKKSLKIPKSIFTPTVLFILSALASSILAINYFTTSQIIIALSFLLRFSAYFILSVITYNLVKREQIFSYLNFLLWLGFIFSALGIIQLIFYPDLSPLQIFGWDPHQKRLVATILDPNYTGGILAIFVSIATSLYLFKNKIIYLLITIFFIFVLFLTFSRSAYLALLISMFVVGLIKSPKVILVIISVFILAFFSITQVKDRIMGAFAVDDTASARIESWQKAIVIAKDNPFFGVGFNTYRFAQVKYNFFTQEDPLGGHSGAGSDSSFLFVAATTGIFGLLFFVIFNLAIFKNFAQGSRENCLKLASFASFAGLILHTQFVNSFFFPQTMLLLWFIVGLNLVYDN